MAYRRRGVGRPSGIIEETPITPSSPMPDDDFIISSSASSSASSLAAAAIRASSAHRDSSISAAYGDSAISSSHYRDSPGERRSSATWKQESSAYDYTSMRNLDDSKTGFWNVLARKAKTIFEEDGSLGKSSPLSDRPAGLESYGTAETHRRMDNPAIQKRIGAMASSLNYIGSTIGKSLEEGLTKVETKAADIISDTRKLHIRRKANDADPLSHIHQSTHSELSNTGPAVTSTSLHADHETQLKASRDVAMAMAAKAKLLLRELKTVKADLAFSKQRCTQLEEENKILRESKEKGDTPEDDDLIRLQLETLLAEKARLAHENSVYARENRFLREIVEYHQLTMQDVVYLDEGIEEVTEVHSLPITAQPLTEIFTESSADLAELAELEDEEPELPLPAAPLSPS